MDYCFIHKAENSELHAGNQTEEGESERVFSSNQYTLTLRSESLTSSHSITLLAQETLFADKQNRGMKRVSNTKVTD